MKERPAIVWKILRLVFLLVGDQDDIDIPPSDTDIGPRWYQRSLDWISIMTEGIICSGNIYRRPTHAKLVRAMMV